MTRKNEMIDEIKAAKATGTTHIWYGNVENAEPIPIDDAIADIDQMDEAVIGDGSWGNYPHYTLRDLAEYIEEREGTLAAGSETCLLGAFVQEYDCTQSIIDGEQGDEPIAQWVFDAWVRAYELLEAFEAAEVDFSLDNLF